MDHDVRGCHAGLLLGALLCVGAPASEMVIVNILGWWHYDRPDLLGVPHWACEPSRSHRQMPDHKVMFSPCQGTVLWCSPGPTCACLITGSCLVPRWRSFLAMCCSLHDSFLQPTGHTGVGSRS